MAKSTGEGVNDQNVLKSLALLSLNDDGSPSRPEQKARKRPRRRQNNRGTDIGDDATAGLVNNDKQHVRQPQANQNKHVPVSMPSVHADLLSMRTSQLRGPPTNTRSCVPGHILQQQGQHHTHNESQTQASPVQQSASQRQTPRRSQRLAQPLARSQAQHQGATSNSIQGVKLSKPKVWNEPKLFILPRPVPTKQYIDQSSQPLAFVAEPRKLLIVLDLNGTLVHRKHRTPNASFTKRPFCNEFIRYVMSEHHVMIWSSAREHNVERLCESIFHDVDLPRPMNRWHRGHFMLCAQDFNANIQLYKQLTWIWEDLGVQASFDAVDFSQADTVLIDDSAEKALSEPYNLLLIDEYDGTDTSTDVLGKVVEYLETARRANDVSCYIRNNPFTFRSADPPYAWPQYLSVGY